MLEIVLPCLCVRLLSVLVVRTTFAPDEYWQSVEVAHRMVFGYGHLTWEWAAGLRGYFHPSIFAALFWGLKVLGLDSAWAVAKGPMLLQALFAAATDLSVYAIARLLFGQQSARWALACQLLSWFNFYCSTRTYSSCLEALFTSAAVYHWLLSTGYSSQGYTWGSTEVIATPSHSSSSSSIEARVEGSDGVVLKGGWSSGAAGLRSRASATPAATSSLRPDHNLASAAGLPHRESEGHRQHQRAWLLLAAIAVVLRPSSALFWSVLGLYQLLSSRTGAAAGSLLLDAASIGAICLALAMLWDRLHYGRWVLVPWEFLRFNLLTGQSALYGAHSWHWNLSQGFPAIAATLLVPMIGGLALTGESRPAAMAALSLAVYSLPANKEFRFLLPALTLSMPYCGPALARLLGRQPEATAAGKGGKERGGGSSGSGRQAERPSWLRKQAAGVLVVVLLAAPQVLAALYFSLMQHRGLAAMPSEVQRLWERSPGTTSVLFLTQCHATPWYSHLHAPIPMRFLDCSPPGWAPAVAQLNAAEVGWLRLPEPPTCPSADASADSTPPARAMPRGSCLSQQQLFRANPLVFVEGVFALNSELPTVLVGYPQQLGGDVAALLQQRGYQEHRHLENCWWQTDGDTPCLLAIWLRGA